MIRDWEAPAFGSSVRRCVVSLAAALYDPEGRHSEQYEGGFSSLADDVERWFGAPAGTTRWALLALLFVLELSPLRFGYGPRRMSALAPRERVAYLVALDAEGVRALDLWKAVLGMAYFGEANDVEPSKLVRLTPKGPVKTGRLDQKPQSQSQSLVGRAS